MIQLIVGDRGKGKTRVLLDSANEAIQEASGNIVYIDKSSKHMFELSNKIRLIDTSRIPVKNYDQVIGAVCGIISQDHDLEKVYIDNLLKIAKIEDKIELLDPVISELQYISDTFSVDFILSVTLEKKDLSEKLREMVVKEL